MTPKLKAEELFNKYATYAVMWTGGFEVEKQNCKQCALIAVDEMIKQQQYQAENMLWSCIGYWKEVKTEIEKL